MDSEKLINLVHENTPLWDMRDKKYHHRDVQRKLWSRVAEEMGFEVDLVKKKWQGLRDVFRKEYNKCVQGKSGNEAPLEMTSSWPHFHIMLFLKDTIAHRKLKGNISPSKIPPPSIDDAHEDEICVSDTANSSCTDNESTPLQRIDYSFQAQMHGSQPSTERRSMNPPTTPNNNKKRKKPSDVDEQFLAIEKEKLQLFAKNVAEKKDSDHQFLMSLLPFLKNVPSQRKLIVRHKLQQVLIDEEQTASNSHTTTSSVSPQSSNSDYSYYPQTENSQLVMEEPSRYTPLSCIANFSNLNQPTNRQFLNQSEVLNASSYISDFRDNENTNM